MAADAHTVGLRDLRHHTSAVLARVRHGETIDVTEHGRPIARIVPVGERQPAPVLDRLVESGPRTVGFRRARAEGTAGLAARRVSIVA